MNTKNKTNTSVGFERSTSKSQFIEKTQAQLACLHLIISYARETDQLHDSVNSTLIFVQKYIITSKP